MPSFRKVYVSVVARFTENGSIVPMSVIWENGIVYEIDRVLDVRPRASLKAGGAGLRFTCRIKGQVTFLYLEEDRWFVEAKTV